MWCDITIAYVFTIVRDDNRITVEGNIPITSVLRLQARTIMKSEYDLLGHMALNMLAVL